MDLPILPRNTLPPYSLLTTAAILGRGEMQESKQELQLWFTHEFTSQGSCHVPVLLSLEPQGVRRETVV